MLTCAKFIKLTPTLHLDMIYWCHKVFCVLDLYFMLEIPWLTRNITVPTCRPTTFTKLTLNIQIFMIYWCLMVVCVLDLHFMLKIPWLSRNITVQSDPLPMNSVSMKTRVIWSKMKSPANFLHNPLPKTLFYINRIIWNPVLSEGIFQSVAD